MKERPLANCEHDFVLQIIKDKKRLDGRRAYDYRNIQIEFGADYGCCHVKLGDTMVMAQVRCDLVEPKQSRPNEGCLMINLDFNHVAAPGFEPSRLSRVGIQMNRLLERCIKECRCVDLETLCIIAEKQVWEIRVDVNVLNHDGNIVDAACLAAVTALSHFKRPDVSVEDGKVTIHPADEKSLITLSVQHMPICMSFSFYHSGDFLLLDASYEEERVREGHMIIAMNKHREICAEHMNGTHLLHKDQIPRCTNIAASKVITITEFAQHALLRDKVSREQGNGPSSSDLHLHLRMHSLAEKVEKSVTLLSHAKFSDSSDDQAEDSGGETGKESVNEMEGGSVSEEAKDARESTMEIGTGGGSAWTQEPISEQNKALDRKRKRRKKVKIKTRASDSEEEEVVRLDTPDTAV
ncbi:exosome complex component RRP45-like isoform X2 [Watersipora subatra]|uniref:exosome complex component RRP45-like isoform X2 n=1 Tax=Watersipora subatra TaxID=2589382 RepID=UPI00355C8514